ncbi:MAG TPA: DUF4236 domain-containing protein, partial [bacterium]|nr:DUF4236 domain-containing protein [bacterium]
MGFYIRKALKIGPVRFNLSKGGVGVSVGAPGLRLGMNAAGTPYVHAGRHGLYYRRSLKLPRPPHSSVPPAAANKITRLAEAQAFEAPQIAPSSSDYNSPGSFSAPPEPSPWWLLIFPVYLALTIIHQARMKRASRYFPELTQALDFSRPETVSASALGPLMRRYELPPKFREWVHEMVYERALAAVFADNVLTGPEREALQRFEKEFQLSPERAREIRAGWFKAQYLAAVADRELTADEEALLQAIRQGLAIPDDEIAGEAQTIARLKKVREIRTEKLEPVPPPVPLRDDELCYFHGPARLLSKKIVNSFQRQGVRYNETGLVTTKQGTMIITSRRLLIVGDGASSIPLDKILDLEADLDLNLVSITKDGRKTPIYISTPESMVAAAILHRMINDDGSI